MWIQVLESCGSAWGDHFASTMLQFCLLMLAIGISLRIKNVVVSYEYVREGGEYKVLRTYARIKPAIEYRYATAP